ncbi:hypothetical protein PFICI_12641 [Pestalotiopsis fici W106-1]|uniref:GEgh 16 protein n=1 Tax=Pestalotiopsis fici (strain W106-1 / CGMCC3.15140) TaxID=1229662 RepID=W3WRC9_PESFW|nr:uncharacterized protein PFICI_12641 [Pestalotiopsis fici W106-1]ETS75697.1 hypothetical protein PFICI_12641 [Pestalotiopsis fici W106-1]
MMYSLRQAFVVSACVALASGQNIISAQGAKSSNTSTGLQVDLTDPNDFNIIRTAEISSNVVNQCGRTVAGGNIDVGAKTEDALANGAVTTVTKGSSVKVTMSVNSTTDTNFSCDLDPQGNVAGATGQTALTQKTANTSKNSKNNKNTNRKLVVRQPLFARAKNSNSANTMTLTVDMPDDLACIGASAGNVCTVRCINADEVGGCFAVQQTDTTALPGDNDPSNIATTAKDEAANQAQIDQNNKDIDAAKSAIAGSSADALTDEGAQNAAVASAIIAADPSVTVAAAAATSSAASKKSGKANKNNKNNKKRDLPIDQRLSSRRSYELLSDE